MLWVSVPYMFCTTGTHLYLRGIAELIAPQRRFGLIDDPAESNVIALKTKSVSIRWEMVFTRRFLGTPDVEDNEVV